MRSNNGIQFAGAVYGGLLVHSAEGRFCEKRQCGGFRNKAELIKVTLSFLNG